MSATPEGQVATLPALPQPQIVPTFAFPPTIPGSSTQQHLFSLYVGELKKDVTEQLLFNLFGQYGQVISIKICRDSQTHISLGYAYVNYRTSQEAEKAIEGLNFSLIDGKPCRIMWSERDSSKRKTGIGNLIIKNIDPLIDAKSLFQAFSSFGKVMSCKIALDDYGLSKGYGFIQYSNEEDALKAQENSNGVFFHKKKLVVNKFIPRSERKDAKIINPDEYTNIFVKNFTKNWTDSVLRKHFEKFGDITSCVVQKNENGESMGYGFVNFAKHECASKATKEMNDFVVEGGNKITVCRAMKKLERQAYLKKQHENHKREMFNKYRNMNLYVKNFDENLTDDQLRELFQEFGEITSARVMKDENNRSRCFGFVCFSKPDDAENALCKMNTKVIEGRQLYVAYAQSKEERIKIIEQKTYNSTFRPALMPPQGMPFMYGPPIGFPYAPQNPFPRYPQSKPRMQYRQLQQGQNQNNQQNNGNSRGSYNNSQNNGGQHNNYKQRNQNNNRGNNQNYGNKSNQQQNVVANNISNVENQKINDKKVNIKIEQEIQATEIANRTLSPRNDFNNKIFSIIQAFVTENSHDSKVIPQIAGVLIDYFTNNSRSYTTVEDAEIREACENAFVSLFKTKPENPDY